MKTVTRLAGTPQAVTDTFTYTADWNQVKTYTDPLNHITTFGYDERGQLTSIMNHNLTQVLDAKNQPTIFGYDKRDRPTSRKDALLNTETATYDGMSNLATVIDRKGQTTTYQYDVLDRPSVPPTTAGPPPRPIPSMRGTG